VIRAKVDAMRAAVVGHVEWIDFLRVETLPSAGDIVHVIDAWSEPGGGGAVSAVQLQKLTGDSTFLTALGDDELGHRAHSQLTSTGLRVESVFRAEPTRRAITHIDSSGERTITVLGPRLPPRGDDRLPWDDMDAIDAVYFTAGDVAALRLARRARIVVATSRILPLLQEAGVRLDAIVGSAADTSEAYEAGDLNPAPGLVVRTMGENGGTFQVGDEPLRRYDAVPPPGPIADRYGAGDSFAAALAWALADGHDPETAVGLAARCGAAVVTGRGPYAAQLTGEAFPQSTA
jgi:ribokinase